MKIYFAMSEFDIGCFEWDSIWLDREKALQRAMELKKWMRDSFNGLQSPEEEFREYILKNYVFEADVIE